MGVIRFEKEVSVAVTPSRMFKAFILDSHNLFPKLVPQAFTSIELEQGNGDVGTIKVLNFAEGGKHKYAKQRVDALDADKFRCKYTVFEEDNMLENLESIVTDIKFEASGNGTGSICQSVTEFHFKGDDHDIKLEEELKDATEQGLGMYKLVEAHLLANPNLYA